MALYEIAGSLGLTRSLICTTKESMSNWLCNEYGYEDDYGERHNAFGMHYPFLKELSVDSNMMGDDDFGDLDGAHPMYEGEFIWLNKARYKELSSAYLAVSCKPLTLPTVSYTHLTLPTKRIV